MCRRAVTNARGEKKKGKKGGERKREKEKGRKKRHEKVIKLAAVDRPAPIYSNKCNGHKSGTLGTLLEIIKY